MVNGFTMADSSSDFNCDACIQAKHIHQPLSKKANQWEVKLGEITHSDLWGLASILGLKGHKYYILFVDEATWQARLMYMTHKNEVSIKVKHYLTWVEHQEGTTPKVIHVDNGCEYVDHDLIMWCLEKGIEIHMTVPYTPGQNGIAEWYNCTIVELVRAMLLAWNLPKELWPEATNYVCYVRNCAYIWTIPDATPYQKWAGEKPDVLYIQEFGMPIWILNELNHNKLLSKSRWHIFIGYDDGPKALKYYDSATCNVKVSQNYHFPLTNLPVPHWLEGEQQHKKNKKNNNETNS